MTNPTRCDRFKDRVGYKGQKYEVRFTDKDTGKECVFGWQNESEGGLANACRSAPWAEDVRVIEAAQSRKTGE